MVWHWHMIALSLLPSFLTLSVFLDHSCSFYCSGGFNPGKQHWILRVDSLTFLSHPAWELGNRLLSCKSRIYVHSFRPYCTHSYSELSYVVQFFLTLHFCSQHLPLVDIPSVGRQVLLSITMLTRTWVCQGAEGKDCWGAAPISSLQ